MKLSLWYLFKRVLFFKRIIVSILISFKGSQTTGRMEAILNLISFNTDSSNWTNYIFNRKTLFSEPVHVSENHLCYSYDRCNFLFIISIFLGLYKSRFWRRTKYWFIGSQLFSSSFR